MENCLKTQLKGVVNNDNLVGLGDAVILVKAVASPSTLNRGIRIFHNKAVTISVSGAYFTDSTFAQNLGTELNIAKDTQTDFFVSNTDAKITIPEKYYIQRINAYGVEWDRANYVLDIDAFKYSSALETFNWPGCYGIKGNLDNIAANNSLRNLNVQNNNIVSGNIENFNGGLVDVRFNSYKVKGNIGNSPMFSANLTMIVAQSPSLSGSIDGLPTCSALTSFNFAGSTGITGVVDDAVFYRNSVLTGVVQLPPNVTGTLEGFANNLYAAGNRNTVRLAIGSTDKITYQGAPAINTAGLFTINLSGDAPVITY